MLAARARRAGRTGIRDYLASRPIVAEIEAIGRAITFAEATGCALHIVHVSSGRGVALVAEAAARGVDVTCETCPHYLVLTEDDVERIGALAKCAPPLRHASECNALWEQIRSGELPMVASDHSPAPAHMKESADFFAIWGGISGCQSTLALLLSAGYHECDIPLTTLASITASGAAQRFGLGPAKGQIAPGCAADLAIIDLNLQWTLHAEQLLYRHQHSPYVGMQLHGQVVRTLARGVTIAHHGIITARHGRGQLLRPAR
jgi:allantoinase